jgi:hypothetical protein
MEEVLSPDGTMVWNGQEWIPRITVQNLNPTITDSVVMGDIKTEVVHNTHTAVHNTILHDSERVIRSHLNTMIDILLEGRIQDSKGIFERAKQIDYDLANKLHNGEYYPKFVHALHKHAESYCVPMVINYRFSKRHEPVVTYNQRFNNHWYVGLRKIQTVMNWDSNYVPTMMLHAEMINSSQLSSFQKGVQAEVIYLKVLGLEPNNKLAKHALDEILRERERRKKITIGISVSLLVLFLLQVIL